MAERSMEEEIDGTETAVMTDTDVQEPQEQDPPKEEPPKEPEPKGVTEEDGPGKPADGEQPPKGEQGTERKDFGEDGHTPKGVQKRFSEFSRQVRGLKDENAQLRAEIEKLRKSQPKELPKGRDQFATDEEWIDHLAGLKADEIVTRRMAEERDRAEMASAKAAYLKTEDEARERVPDFDDVMAQEVNLPVDRDTYMYVMKSPRGAMIQYTLRKVEAVRNQFLATPAEGRLAVVKGIEARLSEIEKQKARPQATPPATATPAQAAPAAPQAAGTPPQAPQVRQPQQARVVPSNVPDPATCSMDEWMEYGD